MTLATQGYGSDPVRELRCPVLMVHGEADEVLVLMPGASHCLDETAEAVCREVRDWVREKLLAV